jgi:hypothetical protein
MKLNFLATLPHYYDHIVPLWEHLPAELRGTFYCGIDVWQQRPQCQAYAQIAHASSGLTLVASYGDYQLTTGEVIYMEHGVGHTYSDDHPAYAGGKGKDRVVLFLNNHAITHEKNLKTYPQVPGVIIGTPKLDNVQPDIRGRRTVCLSFHWNCALWPETHSALPHYKDILPALAKDPRFNLMFHQHPRGGDSPKSNLERLAQRLHVHFERDFDQVMEQADLYVNDNSSTLYEFLLTDRPVIALNAPWYRKNIHHGLRFWDDVPGLMVDRPEDLARFIVEALSDPTHNLDERRRIAQKYYPLHGASIDTAIGVLCAFLS